MKYVVFSVFILSCFFSSAQDWVPTSPSMGVNPNAPRSRWTDKLFTGGTVGLQFGSNQTYVEVSPILGYKLTERFVPGISVRYIYYKFSQPGYSYSTSIYGGSVWSRFFILKNLFAHGEYEVLNMGVLDYNKNKVVRENITSVLVGGGYRQMMGERSALDLLLLWNLNDNINSPYVNPIIRIGFVFGI